MNLTLDVLGKRPDGYHDLCSIMAAIDLYDEIRLETLETGCEVTWEGPGAADIPYENTARKAAKAFFAQRAGGARIHIKKAIPSQAGLGGGSADAAGVLRGLQRL